MSTDSQRGRKRRLPLHPVTQALVRAVRENVWPGPAAAEAFGLKTAEHAEALFAAVAGGEVTAEELDGALGNGPAITRLVARSAANPHKSIEYTTGWDAAGGESKRRKAQGKRRPGYED